MRKYLKNKAARFQDIKFRHKLITLYLFVGVIPILILGIFCYYQSRKLLIEREKNNMLDYMQQSMNTLDNQMQILDNLSDYLSYDQGIAQVVGYPYKSYYEMYEQFTKKLDPVFASFKYFHNDVNRVTIYTNNHVVKHDTTIAPLVDIMHTNWYSKVKGSKELLWFADRKAKKVWSCRNMPQMEQTKFVGVLYIDIDYDTLFQGFENMSSSNYGVFVVDRNHQLLYDFQNFTEGNREKQLTYSELKKHENIDYTVMSMQASHENWTVYVYKPNSLLLDNTQGMILGIFVVAFICIILSLISITHISKLIVGPMEELTKNMALVREGEMVIHVKSEAKDEIGELIRGFGKMIDEINRLIYEVYESKLRQKEYEMKALQAQINPHFLYNTLSLINWKALEAKQPDISRITLRLSSFYRTALNKGKNTLFLRDELDNMKAYLDIQLMMHDYDFDVETYVEEDILECKTLNLILQPLVENAIDHGIDLLEDRRGKIIIRGIREGETVKLSVEDNGVGMSKEKAEMILTQGSKGYGVRNVNERIQIFYGQEYSMKVQSTIGQGTKITISIPYSSKSRNTI